MRRVVRYRIRLKSPTLFGSGMSGAGFDELVHRHPDGYPMIAGARVKGAVRDAIVANRHVQEGLIDQAMGWEDSNGGVLWFSDAKPRENLRSRRLVGNRNRVRLGTGRTAEVGGLRRIEVVEPSPIGGIETPAIFEGCIRLLPGRTDSVSLELAERGLALVQYFGASTNRGMGRVEVAIEPGDET